MFSQHKTDTDDNAEAKHHVVEKTYPMTIFVSGNKIRIILKNTTKEDFASYFAEKFPGKNNCISSSPDSSSYSCSPWGMAWEIATKVTKLEWWIPQQAFNEQQINDLLNLLLNPLNRPTASGDLPSIQRSTLSARDYVTAVPTLSVTLTQAKQCCDSFIAYSQNQQATRGITDADVVNFHLRSPTIPKKQLGLKLFAPAPITSVSTASNANESNTEYAAIPGNFSQPPRLNTAIKHYTSDSVGHGQVSSSQFKF